MRISALLCSQIQRVEEDPSILEKLRKHSRSKKQANKTFLLDY